jgi:hypothetical protein
MLQETVKSTEVFIGLPLLEPADEARRLSWR